MENAHDERGEVPAWINEKFARSAANGAVILDMLHDNASVDRALRELFNIYAVLPEARLAVEVAINMFAHFVVREAVTDALEARRHDADAAIEALRDGDPAAAAELSCKIADGLRHSGETHRFIARKVWGSLSRRATPHSLAH